MLHDVGISLGEVSRLVRVGEQVEELRLARAVRMHERVPAQGAIVPHNQFETTLDGPTIEQARGRVVQVNDVVREGLAEDRITYGRLTTNDHTK